MGKCLGSSKEVLRLAEEVEFFNRLNTTETRSKHLNTKGKIYIRCCGSYGVLMLWVWRFYRYILPLVAWRMGWCMNKTSVEDVMIINKIVKEKQTIWTFASQRKHLLPKRSGL